jgi:hypothetical protein
MAAPSSLARRLSRARSRWLACRHEARQRELSAGVWYRLRRLLADAERAFVIPLEELRALEAEGFAGEPAGLQVEPPLRLLFLPAARAEAIAVRREIPVRLSLEFLTAPAVALVAFAGARRGEVLVGRALRGG